LKFIAECEVYIYTTYQMEYKGNTAFRNTRWSKWPVLLNGHL